VEVYSYAIPGMGDGKPWVPYPDPQPVVTTFPIPKPQCQQPRVPSIYEVIDTLNEACKGDAELFHDLVMKLVKKELGK
jgi:hypothetical protein